MLKIKVKKYKIDLRQKNLKEKIEEIRKNLFL